MLAWVDGLPPATVSADPRLCLVRASTLQEVGRIAEAEQWLAAAARGAGEGSLQAGPASVASGVAASQAINLYFLGDVGGIADTARPALEREEAGSDYWRSALLTTFGVVEFLAGSRRPPRPCSTTRSTASERPVTRWRWSMLSAGALSSTRSSASRTAPTRLWPIPRRYNGGNPGWRATPACR